jgi:hypothetical protein
MSGPPAPAERRLPPIDKLADLALILVIIGGIYMASNLPGEISLAPAWILAGLAALVLVVDIVLLARIPDFAWDRFWQVAGWGLLAYLVIAGMIGYAFVYDGTRGQTLFLLLAMLTIFAVIVPLLLGFAVARYQPVGAPAETAPRAPTPAH